MYSFHLGDKEPMGNEAILISGGGIGGLTAALALGQRGRSIRVFEQAPQFGALGYGIQLGPNVVFALEELGLAQAVINASHQPSAILMLDACDATEIARIPTGAEFRHRFRHPYLVIHRGDLHEILLRACRSVPAIELTAETSITGVEERDNGVIAMTSDGRTIEGCCFVAADGLNSIIRTMIHPSDQPKPVGYVAHRTIVPVERLPEGIFRREMILWSGHRFHIVCYPLRQERFYNIVAVFQTDTHADRRDAAAYKAELLEAFRHAHPHLLAMLGLIDTQRRWAISDRDPIRHWGRGRVTLLGDAAHATLQSLAQGAGMAVEDALCLAHTLDDSMDDVAAAFRHYETLRAIRTARVQLESRALWEVYHCGGIAADVRYDTFAKRTREEYYNCLAWLYDGQNAVTARRPRAEVNGIGPHDR
jgi:3-hydroxybenzoate 6-monooxygenase